MSSLHPEAPEQALRRGDSGHGVDDPTSPCLMDSLLLPPVLDVTSGQRFGQMTRTWGIARPPRRAEDRSPGAPLAAGDSCRLASAVIQVHPWNVRRRDD